MGIQSWYKNKPWFRGGIIGILVCVIWTVFYVTVYNALLVQFFPDGILPMYSLILPIATGHFFIFGSHFVAEGYVAPLFDCVKDSCFMTTDWITLIGMGILLLLIYFGIGAGIGQYLQKKKKINS